MTTIMSMEPAAPTSAPSPKIARADDGRAGTNAAIEIERVDFFYGAFQALHGITLNLPAKEVTAFIGPSGCGKSTLLRCLNRMNDLVPGAHIAEGEIRIHGQDIYARNVDPIELRKRVGMVFQKSNPFPKSIYENITYGLRIQGAAGGAISTRWWKRACGAPRCGTK